MSDYITLSNGVKVWREALDTSAGAGDAGALVKLDAAGRLDNSMMPVGIGADTATIVASETLSAGDFINIWNDTGTPRVRKADAGTAGREAHGFVLAGASMDTNATVYFEGQNTQLSGLTPGARYFLSAATAGEVTATAPSADGDRIQVVGVAISATVLSTEIQEPIIVEAA